MPTLICTLPSGYLKLSDDRIHLSSSFSDAALFGKQHFGYGQFKIKPYHSWRKTQVGKHETRRIQHLRKLRKFTQ